MERLLVNSQILYIHFYTEDGGSILQNFDQATTLQALAISKTTSENVYHLYLG
jgi:hypothetical protein